MKTVPHLVLVVVLLSVILACAAPVAPTLDPNFINTTIAQTYSAAETQTAFAGIPVTGPFTATATKAPSLTPFPTFTLVVIGVPKVTVSVDTNCRTGPGTVYPRVRVFLAGEVAEVVGRSADGIYWVIRNPDRAGEFCWILDEDVTITGLPGIVPVMTAPPTPTATRTRIPSFLPTSTRTRTPVPTATRTRTSVPPATPTRTSTSFVTSTVTHTATASATFTATVTPSRTPTGSSTVTITPTGTQTRTPTPTLTPTFTSTSTSTPTATSTPTPTATATSTATPAFTASYSGMESCTGTGWWVEFQMNNTGGATFDLMILNVTDTTTGTVLPLNSADFINRNGCSTSDTQDDFPPGATLIVSSAAFSYDPSGHALIARITLCSNPGPTGTCVTQTITFTP